MKGQMLALLLKSRWHALSRGMCRIICSGLGLLASSAMVPPPPSQQVLECRGLRARFPEALISQWQAGQGERT